MVDLLATFAVIGVLLGLVWAQRRFRALQYLFLLRYPLTIGVIGVGLPLVSSYGPAANLLDNLYVLDHWFAALWLGIATAWLFAVVWLTGELIFRAGDERFGIAFARSQDDASERANDRWLEGRLGPGSRRLATVAVFVIATSPMLVVLGLRSTAPGVCVTLAAIGVALVVAGVVWEGQRRPLARVTEQLRVFARLQRVRPRLARIFTRARASELLRGYDDVRGHQVALVLFGVTTTAYLAGALLLPPWRTNGVVEHFPAIGYVLVLLTLFGLILPGLSFLLDLFRVPVLIGIAVLVLPLQLAFDRDHYFAAPLRSESEPVDPLRALDLRFADEREPVLVVVAASGGGGQAAVWTSRVFEGLVDEGAWGRRVLDSVGLVSTASGGSVGAMYWVDAYTPEGAPSDPATIERLRAAAEGPSLEPMAWGIAYPDTIRLLAPMISQLGFPLLDRARAMEMVWNERFVADTPPTLASWSQGVREGWRPLLILNSTAVESGCRVIFGAASLAREGFAGAIVFPVDRHDLEISTAARLSASFPYLSPASRAEIDVARGVERKRTARTCSDLDIGGQHLVDGGFYDNYGIVSSMQWLDQVLHADVDRRFRKVVVVEIRSMSKQFERSEVAFSGLVAQLAGPLITLMSVRTSSQIDRNDETLRQFAEAWAERGVKIETVQFEAHNEQRLSWSLTAAKIAEIRANWTDDPEVVCARRRLCELIGGRECPGTIDACAPKLSR
ncbi:hypothetical protein ACNOYE_32185 [Nannocystaceae bacterium ST9]